VTHPEHDEHDGEVDGGLYRRIEPWPASEKTASRDRLEAYQLDSWHTVAMSRTAVLTVVTARFGTFPIDGDGRCRSGLGFRYGEKMERGRNSGTRVRRGPLYGARARLVTPSVEEGPPATKGRGARRLAGVHARRKDEDDLLLVILTKG
jgi:hypothetical protein